MYLREIQNDSGHRFQQKTEIRTNQDSMSKVPLMTPAARPSTVTARGHAVSPFPAGWDPRGEEEEDSGRGALRFSTFGR